MIKMKRKKNIVKEVIAILVLIFIGAFLPFIITYEKPNYIEILNDTDFSKYNFEGDGSIDKPILIENLYINYSQKRGISISNTEKYFVIRNCYLSFNLLDGIRILAVKNGTALIYNNTIIGHSYAGINIQSCNSVKVYYNRCFENRRGIIIDNSSNSILDNNQLMMNSKPSHLERFDTTGLVVSNSNFTTINENYIKFTTYGIVVENGYRISLRNNFLEQTTRTGISLKSSMLCEVVNCSSLNNLDSGIELRYSMQNMIVNSTLIHNRNGIFFYESIENIIEYNTIESNNVGLHIISSSHGNEITYNNFTNNSNEGIKIGSCSDNKIHHNNFFENNLSDVSQCEDNGLNNSWYDNYTLEGNYWNEWNSTDPYNILGTASSIDPYPLLFIIKNSQIRIYVFRINSVHIS